MFKVRYVVKVVLMLICIGNSKFVFAQQDFMLKGIIFNKQNNQRAGNTFIFNTNTKITVSSDDLGGFVIKAKIGDTLKISKRDYNDYFYLVFGRKDAVIQLSPVIQLKEVTIVERTKKQELDDAMRQYRSQGSFYNGKPPASIFLAAPLTGLYELFGKTPKQAKHFQQFAKNETEQINIDKRFNKSVVKQFSDLTDEQLEHFMEIYRPSYDQLLKWNDYDLITYIKTSAQQLKDGKSPPPLKKLF